MTQPGSLTRPYDPTGVPDPTGAESLPAMPPAGKPVGRGGQGMRLAGISVFSEKRKNKPAGRQTLCTG